MDLVLDEERPIRRWSRLCCIADHLIIVQTLADEGLALLRRELSAAVPSDENGIHVDAIVAKPAIRAQLPRELWADLFRALERLLRALDVLPVRKPDIAVETV